MSTKKRSGGRSGVTPDERAELIELRSEVTGVIFDDSDGAYGVPRMFRALRKQGDVVNRKRVRRLVRRHGLAVRFISKRRRPRSLVTTLT